MDSVPPEPSERPLSFLGAAGWTLLVAILFEGTLQVVEAVHPGAFGDFVTVSTTKVLPAVESFMNFHLDPKNYAEFVNTLHISVLVDAARPYVKQSIKNDPLLFPSKKVQSRIVFSLPRGEAQKFWDDAWASFKSA